MPNVIRIVGSSYSGSTALGYFLDTFDGFLFGSELYRLLPCYVCAHEPPRITPCDACGMACPIWTEGLRASILGRPDAGVVDVYKAFFDATHGLSTLVDGSKSVRWYQDAPAGMAALTYLVALKHPLRLLASFAYNRTDLLPRGRRSTLAACAAQLAQRRDDVLAFADTTCRRLAQEYDEILELAASFEHVLCRTDSPESVNRALDRIALRHGTTYALAAMGRKPCHSLGGNRSLVWQARGFASGPGQPARDQARFDYYREQAGAPIVQDNKYEILFDARMQASMRALPSYRVLAGLLGCED